MKIKAFLRAARWLVLMPWVSTMDDGCALREAILHANAAVQVTSGR